MYTGCAGVGRRVTPTGSSAFPEVPCPVCGHYASPVRKYGETLVRFHRARKTCSHFWQTDPLGFDVCSRCLAVKHPECSLTPKALTSR